MPRVPRPLARKLDRLARRAHRFHRFAHHPLCAEYAGELVRLGRRARVCRGCVCALAGCALGAAAAPMLLVALGEAGASSAACACWVALGLSLSCSAIVLRALRAPPSPVPAARAPKFFTRFLPAATFAFACVLGARAGGAAFAVLLAGNLAVLALLFVRYRRRGPSRTPCQSCPERAQAAPCRGYAPIVRRERAFARVARRMLA